jgi:predicted CoA-binding protein
MWGVQNDAPGDDVLRLLLREVETIAVLGAKAGPRDDAYEVASYMQQHGYRILPVNPRLEVVLGVEAKPALADLSEPVDLVDVFRAPRHLSGHTEEILAMQPRPRVVWLQLGIRDDVSAARLRDAGITVVQNRCLMVEHRRLLLPPVR